jgi:hypothetical protein
LDQIEQFYRRINEWLQPLKSKNLLDYSFEEVIIKEENLGVYQTKRMAIFLQNEKVILEPIGTLLMGVRGRIDMNGRYGNVKFVLVNKK